MSDTNKHPELVRTLGLGALIVYGVGDMLGSGIYALVGKIAGTMGHATWLAFTASMIAASLTALSYASLGSRYPKAGGAAYVSHRAFARPFLSYVVGLAVLASGLTSMATQANAFAGYFTGLVEGSAPWIVMLGFVGLLTVVNVLGMRESSWLNAICTFVEVSGLLIVIAVGLKAWGGVDLLQGPQTETGTAPLSLSLALQGGALAFYAFVGFEDMINVSEEAKNPRRDFPIAVVVAMAVTATLYIAVSITAVSVLSPAALNASKQPLVDVVRAAEPRFPVAVFSGIALFAIANTALLNYMMGARLVYGMARERLVPAWLGALHPTRRTPHRAILALMTLVIGLMFAGNIRELASATSALLQCVFVVVNASLLVLRHRPGEPQGSFELPRVIPALGIVVSLAMLAYTDRKALAIAAIVLVLIAVLYRVVRPPAEAIERQQG